MSQTARSALEAFRKWGLTPLSGHLRELPEGMHLEKIFDPEGYCRFGDQGPPWHFPCHYCDREPTVEGITAYAAPFDGLRVYAQSTVIKTRIWDPYWFSARLVHFPDQVRPGERNGSLAEAVATQVFNPGLGSVSFLDPWFSKVPHQVFILYQGGERFMVVQARPWLGPGYWHHRLRVFEEAVPFPPRETCLYQTGGG